MVKANSIGTGHPVLDDLTGIGGWPVGAIAEVLCDDPVLRAYLGALAVADGRGVAVVDGTGTLVAAVGPGVRLQSIDGTERGRMPVAQPGTLEDACRAVRWGVESGARLLVVSDALSLPSETASGELVRSQTVAKAVRLLLPDASRRRCAVLFLGPRKSDNALRFFASLRVEVFRTGAGEAMAVAIKNKLSPPFSRRTLDLPGLAARHEAAS